MGFITSYDGTKAIEITICRQGASKGFSNTNRTSLNLLKTTTNEDLYALRGLGY